MEKKVIKTWGITLFIFLAIFIACIATIFQRFEVVTQIGDFVRIDTYGPGSVLGIEAMAKTWVHNPNYFIGIGFMGLLSVTGAAWSIYMMNKAGKEE